MNQCVRTLKEKGPRITAHESPQNMATVLGTIRPPKNGLRSSIARNVSARPYANPQNNGGLFWKEVPFLGIIDCFGDEYFVCQSVLRRRAARGERQNGNDPPTKRGQRWHGLIKAVNFNGILFDL
jgi:hypothetical protein